LFSACPKDSVHRFLLSCFPKTTIIRIEGRNCQLVAEGGVHALVSRLADNAKSDLPDDLSIPRSTHGEYRLFR
jgi:hypothetical protein